MRSPVGRGWVSWVVLAAVAGPVLAQTPPPPDTEPAVTVTLPPPASPPDALLPPPQTKPTQPPERLLPPPKQTVPTAPPRKQPEPPETPTPPTAPLPTPRPTLEVPPGVITSVSPAGMSAAGYGTRPVDLKPLPGSLEDELQREHAARAGFRYCTGRNTTVTMLPNSLLWESPFAIKREPRMLVQPTSLDNYRETWTLDTSIGTTVGLFRTQPAGRDVAYQLDVFGVVHTRLTPDDLIVSDYRFGIPLTARRGPWQFKLAYEHTSSHLADDYIRTTFPYPLFEFTRDEAVFGVGRWFADRVRVYGQVAYAFDMLYPFPVDEDFRWRFDAGFEWFCPEPTGLSGTPYVALNIDARGDAGFQPGATAQAGWLWRNPYQRLANVRLFAEYTNSRSPYGQFFLNREDFYSVGLSCDY